MKRLKVILVVGLLLSIITGCSNGGVTINDATPPSVPTGLSGTVTSSTSVALTWTESTDNVGVAGYRVYRDGMQIIDSILTSCTDTGLVSDMTYNYTVLAYDASDNISAQSSTIPVTVKITIPDTIPPSVPTSLFATVTSATSIQLNWTASTDDVGVAGYRMYRDGMQIADSISTSYADTGLLSSATYYYSASAYDAAGNVSAQSSAIPVAILELDSTPPSVPEDLYGIATSSSIIDLRWTASTDIVGVAGYKVFRNGAQICDGISTSCTDTGLAYSTTYDYTVLAYDKTGNMSAQAPTIAVTTPMPGIGGFYNNLTILDGQNTPIIGANDVIFVWDKTLRTSVDISGQVSNAIISSACTIIGLPWKIHDMVIYGQGTYTVYTDCSAGSPGCGAGTPITFTVFPGEIGGHMLFDWSIYKNMDVVNIWQSNAVFEPMFTGRCGSNPADKKWNWMSSDWDGDGKNGSFLLEGAPLWSVNFNLD